MNYFLKHSYYVILGALSAVVLSALISEMKWELILIVVINAFMVRLLDDCFDYVKDKKAKNKKQPLSFKHSIFYNKCCFLWIMGIVLAFDDTLYGGRKQT